MKSKPKQFPKQMARLRAAIRRLDYQIVLSNRKHELLERNLVKCCRELRRLKESK